MAYTSGLSGIECTNGVSEQYQFEQKLVQVEAEIRNYTCCVNAELVYKGHAEHISKAVFSTPLKKSLQSSLYKCDVTVGEFKSCTQWWPADKVKKTVDGDENSAVLSVHPEENWFICVVGDIPPETTVQISLSYTYIIPFKDDYLLFQLIAAASPDKGVPCDISLKIQNDTHAIAQIKRDSDIPVEIEFSKKNKSLTVTLTEPLKVDAEFEFRFVYTSKHEVSAICERGSQSNSEGELFESDVAMVSLYPDLSSDVVGGNQGEFIFVIDRSGSMSGPEIEHAKQTLLLFLKSLPVGCYFNIVSFGSRFELLFKGGSVQYDSDTLKKACQYQEKMDADFGGTSLAPPLKAISKKKPMLGYPRKIFILTDGKAWDKDEAIREVKANKKNTTVSAFGIGTCVDRKMVQDLSVEGNGIADFVEAFDRSMESKVMMALRTSMVACASQFEVTVTAPGGTTAELLGFRQEPVYLGEACNFGIKLCGSHSTKKKVGKVSVKYNVGDDTVKTSCNLDWGNIPDREHMPIHKLLASHMMQSMLTKEDMTDNKIQECYTSYSTAANIGGHSELTKAVIVSQNGASVKGVVQRVKSKSVDPIPAPASRSRATPTFGARKVKTARKGRIYRGNIDSCLSKPVLKRIAYRGGIKRMNCLCHAEIQSMLQSFLRKMIGDCVLYAENGRRRTVTEQDVDCALRKNGVKLYGIEDGAPQPWEKDGNYKKRPRRIVKRSTPIGNPTAQTSVVGSVLGISSMSKPAMKKTVSKLSVKNKKASLVKTSSIKSNTSDATASPPSEPGTSQRTGLHRKSTEILKKSEENLALAKPSSFTKPNLSRVRSAMKTAERSEISLKRKASKATNEGPPSKIKVQTKGKGRGKTVVAAKSQKVVTTTISRMGSVTRGKRASGSPKDFTTMVTMITLQTFDGSWDMSQGLATLIGKSKSDLTTAAAIKDLKAWATALALCWLEKNFGEQRTEWEMIHYKGFEWLNKNQTEKSQDELMKSAAKHIKN